MRIASHLRLINTNCLKVNASTFYYKLNQLNNNYLKRENFQTSSKSREKRWSTSNSAVTEHHDKNPNELTIGEKVAQTTKDATYLGIIIGGIGVTAIILYAVFKELFSSSSPNVIYSNALKRCKSDARVVEAVGEPIKGFGEETSRGRRRHVSFINYQKDDTKYIRVKFYIKGCKRRATVHLEMKENDSHTFEYRYLFVELDGFPQETIVIEDNRLLLDSN